MESIIIAGGTGTVGRRLVNILVNKDYNPIVLTRQTKRSIAGIPQIKWDTSNRLIEEWPEGPKYIVNLSGAGIADKRWSARRKSEILESRILSTQTLVRKISEDKDNVVGFLSASAIGYYGNGGEKLLTEESDPVTEEFLSEVCMKWEEEALKAKDFIKNVCVLRIGTVLTKAGGALVEMDRTIPFGIANYLGTGKQHMSWIHIDDLCLMIEYCIRKNLSGIYNAVSPHTLTNKAFMRILKNQINPKAIMLPVPSFAIKTIFGELSKLVLNSSNVSSNKIESSGFNFQYVHLKEALREIYS